MTVSAGDPDSWNPEALIRDGILSVLGVGVARRNTGAVVNALVSFGASFLPDVAENRYGVDFRPWQRVYTEIAVFTHAVGMLGLYDDTWWWDHLTHVHSATLLGGAVHVVARRRGRDPRPRVLAAVVAGGVLWEIVEYAVHTVTDRLDLDPVLIPYSARDTALDLLFNAVGAVLVVAFGDRFLGNLQETDRSP